MIKSNYLMIFILSLAAIFGTAAQSDCNSKKNKNTQANANTIQNTISTNKMTNEKTEPISGGEMKILAEGSFGKIEQPFLFVARDPETFARLKNLIEDLPPASEVNFANQAVVAAFAGTKNTGGYSVEIKNAGGKISVSVNSPPPDAMVTEALTMPYKIAAVPVKSENPVNLEVSEEWKKTAEIYKISSGTFEYSGGITGRGKSFTAEGTIDVYRFDDLVTLRFNLSGTGAEKNMKLTETASGVLSGGKLEISRLDAGSFSEGPKPPVKVSGAIANDSLELSFEPLQSNVADGFQVRGKLKAVRNK